MLDRFIGLRWLQFNVRTLLLLTLVVGLWFGLRYAPFRSKQNSRDLARLLAAIKVSEVHSQTTPVTMAGLAAVPVSIKRPWSGQFILRSQLVAPTGTFGDSLLTQRVALDPFETDAVARLQAGEEEVFVSNWRGDIRYARRIDAKTSGCASCHAGPKGQSLIGYVTVDLPAAND